MGGGAGMTDPVDTHDAQPTGAPASSPSTMYGYSACRIVKAMIETNPIQFRIDDLKERVASLRGYL